MKRSERRALERKRARCKALRKHLTPCSLFDGDSRKAHLRVRAGGVRHQPRHVREILLGKRRCMTRAEQEAEKEFVNAIVEATLGLAVGLDEDLVFDHLHKKLKEIDPELEA